MKGRKAGVDAAASRRVVGGGHLRRNKRLQAQFHKVMKTMATAKCTQGLERVGTAKAWGTKRETGSITVVAERTPRLRRVVT